MESRDPSTHRNPAWALMRDLIHERSGIHFGDESMELMVDKITDLMAERDMDPPVDYYYLLKYEGEPSGEWENLLNAISVRETYFWREIDQIRAFVKVLLPECARTLTKPLRIWSAACASGEEPVSIAMALDQERWFDRIPIEIYASDMSSAAIYAAQRGIYKERSFRNLPVELRNRYFTATPDRKWEVLPELRRRIMWRRANLAERAEIEYLAGAPFIFCRNVFIYFSGSTIRKVIKTYEECMPSPGYLFLGAAESLVRFTKRFRLEEIGGAFVYVKD